jgi:hypothetical protein
MEQNVASPEATRVPQEGSPEMETRNRCRRHVEKVVARMLAKQRSRRIECFLRCADYEAEGSE